MGSSAVLAIFVYVMVPLPLRVALFELVVAVAGTDRFLTVFLQKAASEVGVSEVGASLRKFGGACLPPWVTGCYAKKCWAEAGKGLGGGQGGVKKSVYCCWPGGTSLFGFKTL